MRKLSWLFIILLMVGFANGIVSAAQAGNHNSQGQNDNNQGDNDNQGENGQ